ncbi:hypothetical protein NA57DRAFT_48428 [Rhizodiscina lignyota]|uniref:HTH TFE/IIEalpha-type domain-containing protein n=1 Tax=Rhizodiscina lignyota TaxID=1504668 RepID=A0A9P4M3L3_9PEZI|nr:hypothetical protein NA57DRAFT_48428 [Rhizodiscina lignyota]
MELAKVLVRTVARAFYDTEHVIVVDALVMHSALSSADLSIAMLLSPSNSNKIIQRLIGKLREGGLVSVYTRQETRDGATKPQARDYYYIDYRRAIDSIKWKVHVIHEKIKAASSSTGQEEKKEWHCMRCKSQYTMMEVLDLTDQDGRFLCRKCGNTLSELGDEIVEQDDTTALFNKQFGPILNLLQKIDDVTVPESTGEQALANARPMPRSELNPAPKVQVAPSQVSRPTAVKGQATGPEEIRVSITSESESTAAKAAEEAERRQKIAAQNQLPEWHERSTVTGEFIKNKADGAASRVAAPVAVNGEEKEEKKVEDSEQMDIFYAMLEKERLEKERKQQEEEDEEDEEDDDDEFEDVAITGANGTPLVKKPRLENNANPAMNVKVEGKDLQQPAAPDSKAGEESDEDDDEFENVM